MKLTLEVYSTSAGDAGGAPSFGVRIRDRRALEAGALYDPLDVNFLVDKEFLPAPETVAVSIYRPSEDGEDALVATTAGSAFAPVPGHSMMRRGALATATPGFDSWYKETRCPDGGHTYPVPVFSALEVRWSCGAEDYVARADAVPAILTPIGVRAVKGLDGEDGEDGKAPTVDVADLGGTYRMTVTSPDGTVQTVEWRDGRDGDGANFPVPVSPADATKDDQYADALSVKGLLDSLRKDLSGVEARLDVFDSLTGIEYLESIRESLDAKVDKRVGYDLVSTGYISVLDDFIGTFGGFGDLAGLDKITFNELGTDLAERFRALESAVGSLPPSDDGGTLNAGYVKFLDTVVASGDDSAQRILDAVNLVLAESNDAGMGIWKAVNANAKGLADLEAKVGSGGTSSIPVELEAMIRNSVQKDAFGRGFSSNDFTQDYIDRINNSVQQEAGKGLSTVDFTMERAKKLDALYNSSSTLNPPVKPDENAKEGQPADAKDTYEALKGLSLTSASTAIGTDWTGKVVSVVPVSVGSYYDIGLESFRLEWQKSGDGISPDIGWCLTHVTFTLTFNGSRPGDYTYQNGTYSFDGSVPIAYDENATLLPEASIEVMVPMANETGYRRVVVYLEFTRELYAYEGDPYVTKTYVDNRITDEIGKIEIPEPDVTLPNDFECATLRAANSVTVGSRSSADTPGQSSFSSGRGNIASGDHSHAEGDSVIAKGLNSHAEGCTTEAKGNCSHAEGKYTEASGAYSHAAGFRAKAQQRAYAWNGVESDTVYESNGDGTYNINPAGGIEGFFIGQKNLKTIFSEEVPAQDLSGYVKKTDSGGIYLGLQFNDDMENSPLFLDIEGAVRMGQPSSAGDEALLEMQAGGRPGGFKVRVEPSYDESAGSEVSRTTVSIDGIEDVAGELGKISAKRDKVDNIATTLSYSSRWNVSYEIYSDSEELKAKLELWFSNTPTSISGSDSEGWNWNNLPVIEGYYIEDAPEIEGAYAHTTYISDTDLYGFSIIGQRPTVVTPGEPYVTPSGVKALTASGFSRLVPETSEGKVTLKPVDGNANWVDGTVLVPNVTVKNISANVGVQVVYTTNAGEFMVLATTLRLTQLNARFDFNYWSNEGGDPDYSTYAILGMVLTEPLDITWSDNLTGVQDAHLFPTQIPSGFILKVEANLLEWGDESGDINGCSFTLQPWTLLRGLDEMVPSDIYYNGEHYTLEGTFPSDDARIVQSIAVERMSVCVGLPGTADTTGSRRFSLTLATDVEKETDVTWEGATGIVEAFPGASKLALGEVIWDVKEVAPGKFRVDRASNPAQSAPLTLTSPSGRVAELTVGDDLVLEVKEK